MQNYVDFLNLLNKTHRFQQKAFVQTAENNQVHAICECAYSIVQGNIHIPQGMKGELTPKKQMLRDLSCRYREKRKNYH